MEAAKLLDQTSDKTRTFGGMLRFAQHDGLSGMCCTYFGNAILAGESTEQGKRSNDFACGEERAVKRETVPNKALKK